jgi:VanZ family protein
VLKQKNILFLRAYAPAIVWGIFILIATLTPGKSLPSSSLFRFDKLIHIFIFGMFAWLVLRGLNLFHVLHASNIRSIYARVGAATIGFGIAIELIQQLIPDRGADMYDVLANTLGILAAQFLFYFTHKKTTV